MTSTSRKNRTIFKKKWIIIISIILLLIIIRLVLPRIVLYYVNKSLANLEGYYGHVDDIDLRIYRGAYQIDNIFIDKIDSISKERIPFFDARKIDLSVEWRALLDGEIVGEIIFLEPAIIFTKDKAEPKEVQQDTTDFKQVLDDIMPLRVNKFEIINGSIHYLDESSTPVVDIKMDQFNALALNLSSVRDTALLPATIEASANVYKGKLNLNVKLDPLADDPTFDLNAELSQTSLPEFNDFFQAYGKIDVNKGTFGLATEIAAKDGKFVGYVKPVINDLDVRGPEDKEDNFLRQAWESIAGTIGKVLENPKKEQVATKIPIEGSFDQTTIGVWYAITEVLKNAFIQALYPSLDYQISIGDVEAQKPEDEKGFFEKLFTGKDKEEKEEDREKEKKDDDK